jgi:hypothetical protein
VAVRLAELDTDRWSAAEQRRQGDWRQHRDLKPSGASAGVTLLIDSAARCSRLADERRVGDIVAAQRRATRSEALRSGHRSGSRVDAHSFTAASLALRELGQFSAGR